MTSYTNQEFYKYYDEFKTKYFNELDKTCREICNEVGISSYKGQQLTNQIKEETGLMRKYTGVDIIITPVTGSKPAGVCDYDFIYEEFKGDYLYSLLSPSELKRKYNLTHYQYYSLTHKVKTKTKGWMRKNGHGGYLINKYTNEERRLEL